jgi:ribonuclease J
LLPRLEGLYAEEQIRLTDIPYKTTNYDGVLVSHAHVDHVGYLNFLDESLPVYCGETSKTILGALLDSGGTDVNPSSFKGFRTGDKLRIGSLEIEPIHVDHSIPGAYAFIIHTTEGTVVYTGDLRLHGPAGKMTEEFIAKAAEEQPIALLCEGTRVGQEESHKLHSENEVKEAAQKIVSNTSRLITTSFYGRDIDRINTFYSIAKASDRKFIVNMKMALLLSRLKDDPHLVIPDILSDENTLVYKKRKKTGVYDEKDYFKWERPFVEKAVDHKYVHDNQSKSIIAIEPSSFTELIDIRPDPGGYYIYSMSEPHSELEAVDEEIQRNWLNHFQLNYSQIHASGHAPPKDLDMIINKIRPKTLIPIHTEHPDELRAFTKKGSTRIIIPEMRHTYTLS